MTVLRKRQAQGAMWCSAAPDGNLKRCSAERRRNTPLPGPAAWRALFARLTCDERNRMTMNDEELFEHLQELVAELPAMQEKGAVLARARAAAEVAKRAHYYEGQQNELNGILSEMAEHERQRAIAIEQGDREREEAQRALILTCGTQRGIRKGAADAAKRELDQALSDGGFASCEEARAVRLSEPDLASLSAEIEAYQADYAETLAACERIEASEAASADAEGVEEA